MTRRLWWFCLGVLLAALPMLSFAAGVFIYGVRSMNQQSVAGLDWESKAAGYSGGYFDAPSERAAADRVGLVSPGNLQLPGGCNRTGDDPAPVWVNTGTRKVDGVTYTEFLYRVTLASSCGGDATIGVAVRSVPIPPCPEGQERDAFGQCSEPPCEAGQTGSTSVQVGWSNFWDVNAKPYGVSTPVAGCAGECKVVVTGLAEQSCYLGDSGAGAPYQVLCWYKTETTGEQCTSGEGQLSDRRDPIPCPAGTTQGTIGDKSACLPSTTTETETRLNPDGTTTETTTKTNPDGSTEVTTTEKDAAGNVIRSTTTHYPAPGGTGSGSSGGEPGQDGGPQGTEDPLKECVENPDACKEGGGDFGAGAPDAADLFVRDQAKTFAAVLTKFRSDMGQTAFGQAVAGYFDVSGGGSCPVWSSTIPFIDTTITIDQFCDPAVADMLAVMRGALLVVFGFVAFRFAVL